MFTFAMIFDIIYIVKMRDFDFDFVTTSYIIS